MKPTLVVPVGLPGSGKTTRAKAWVAEDPEQRVRINRDDLRKMMHGGRLGTSIQEMQVSAVQHAGVLDVLLLGFDVVVDDTNLNVDVRKKWSEIARAAGAQLEVWDLTTVPLRVCVQRDAAREGAARVGVQVIADMHDEYIVPLGGRPVTDTWPGAQ